MSFKLNLLIVLSLLLCCLSQVRGAQGFQFKKEMMPRLIEAVPQILAKYDNKTGRFGEGIWNCRDQEVIYPLAVAWATASEGNPYYHNPEILDAIMAGGDALIEDADKTGQWVFRKKDGSTWGKIYMPWTYVRWIRAYALIKDAMPENRRRKWEDALCLGYDSIAKTQLVAKANTQTHLAMGLYIAGQSMNRPDWMQKAKSFMADIVAKQNPEGFWTENYGPVVHYNHIYVDAIGIYYILSKDETVLPALKRSVRFHSNFTYPDGSMVETIDERNPYRRGAYLSTVALTATPEGRGYLARQHKLGAKLGMYPTLDEIASFLLYGIEGPAVPVATEKKKYGFVSDDKKALIRRAGPWYVCASAYACPVANNRWIQDRQNFVSVFNDRCGLIIGGGNTKLQPLWSSFTVGDKSLLTHKPGDENPNFIPPKSLIHVPSSAAIIDGKQPGVKLTYGQVDCEIDMEPVDEDTLRLHVKAASGGNLLVEGHITLIPHPDKPVVGDKCGERKLGDEAFALSGKDVGSWITHAGWKLSLPEEACLIWPVKPHNPYKKDGSATTDEALLVVSLPFSENKQVYTLELKVK